MLRRRALLAGAGALGLPSIVRANGCRAVPAGTGPAVSSSFLTVDFTSPVNYATKSVQQVVRQQMWGASSGGVVNNGFAALANANYTNLMGQVNPGLWMLKNGGENVYFSTDGNYTVQAGTFANLVSNFYKVDPLGISRVAMGCNWDQISNPSFANYAKAMANLATYLLNYTMPNGKKFPLFGVLGYDEPDNHFSTADIVSYYQALAPAIKAVNSGLHVFGPQTSYQQFADEVGQVPQQDGYSWDYYHEGSQHGGVTQNYADTSFVTSYGGDLASGVQASQAAASNATAVMVSGYNEDYDCSNPPQNSFSGACFIATVLANALNSADRDLYAAIWDGWGDGTCGMITDPINQAGQYYGVTSAWQITPKAYLTAQGVRNIYGPRWAIPANSAGLTAVAVTPDVGRIGLLVVNVGHGNQSGQVALSHWPVSSTGNGTANVWQMTSAVTLPGTDGTTTTAPVSNGLVNLSFPDPSVTVVSV